MELFVLGTSQAVASTKVRERMHVDLEEVYRALQTLMNGRAVIAEAVPLATCARLELYGLAPDVDRAVGILGRLMAQRANIQRDDLVRHSYVHRGADAVRHLFRVAAGLDSVVQGEAQILGQVRDAAHHPSVGTTEGPVLHRLFQNAISAGKRVRTETEIGRGAASLASASLTMLQRDIGTLKPVSALVLGAGDTGATLSRLLVKAGVGRLIVANRTLTRAQRLAENLGAEACSLQEVPNLLSRVDLVVGAVTTQDYLITPAMVKGTGEALRPRYFLDLAHPRNFDPALKELSGVTVFDLEQVFRRVEAARRSRAAQVPRAEGLVEDEMTSFLTWLRSRENVVVVKAVRTHFLERALAEAERYVMKVPEEHREHMRGLARSVARALLHQPTLALREADPDSEEGRALLTHAPALFGIQERTADGAAET